MGNQIYLGDNLDILAKLEPESVNLIYTRPPSLKHERIEDYLAFLEPRLSIAFDVLANNGTLYFHGKFDVIHYCKVELLDKIFDVPNCFINEIIWTYETNEEIADHWVAKHDTILLYVKNPKDFVFNEGDIDRISYLAPGLVGEEKESRGKLPTDVWWHTNLEGNGHEETGAKGQLPLEIIKRIINASSNKGDTILDFFARDGKVGMACLELNRNFILIDNSRMAVKAMARRFSEEKSIEWVNFDPRSHPKRDS